MYTPNVECITQKNESILAIIVLFSLESTVNCLKSKKITKKCPDCEIHGSWLKDTFRNDLYLRFIRSCLSLLLNIHYFFSPDFFRR